MKWQIDRTITLPYIKGSHFTLVIAFTREGTVKVTGSLENVRNELDKYSSCHAFRIVYLKKKTERVKNVSWDIVGSYKLNPGQAIFSLTRYGKLGAPKGFYLIKSVSGLIKDSVVVGSWRRMPTVYLREFEGEAHKTYPYRKVYLCEKCRSIIRWADEDLPTEIATRCRTCFIEVNTAYEEIIGGTQVSVPIKPGKKLEEFHDFKMDTVEKRLAHKHW